MVGGASSASPERFDWTGTVTDAMRAAYERDGFLVLDGFADPDACAALSERVDGLIAEAAAPDSPTVFGDHAGDRYFLESGDKIRVFFEPDAVDAVGRPNRPIEQALNKIGHAMHDLDPVFDRFCRGENFRALSQGLGLETSVLLQSMVIFKQPGVGAEVGWHQDATFLRTQPHSVTGYWLALEEASVENGCLYAIPGGHKGPLRQWFGRAGDHDALEMRDLDDTTLNADAAVPLEAATGTLVVLHGFLPHMSTPNRSDRSRRAMTLHTVDGGLPYPSDNWLQRPGLGAPRGFGPEAAAAS
ncbi:MAG: phytanoyl-CoA dioxygenase family protein [Alphaproteobacteria bacterium]|nr:phytanoyl-CoA dioxygenase family protein [Alphaproteobacteria bacterium]